MRRLLALFTLLMSLSAGAVLAQTATYSTEESPIGELLDYDKTRAVLEKHIPEFVKAERIDEARGMTLRGVQPYATEMLTDEVLDKIDADLAKVPAQ